MPTARKTRLRYRKRVVVSAEDMLISQRAAQRLMGEPAFVAALEELEAAYFEQWGNTAPNESEKREIAYFGLRAAIAVRERIQGRARSAGFRDSKDAAARALEPKCPGCGVGDGEKHTETCPVLAARRRTQKLANG